MNFPTNIEEQIKAEALRLGFSTCGIAIAEEVDPSEYAQVEEWVAEGYHGSMSYLERNHDLRRDPRLLVPGCKSVIMVAMNYYPEQKQKTTLSNSLTMPMGAITTRSSKKDLTNYYDLSKLWIQSALVVPLQTLRLYSNAIGP